jgi:hypothetical protein
MNQSYISQDRDTLIKELSECLCKVNGPIMQGEALYKALGYKTLAGFNKAYYRGTVPIPVFKVKNKKGRYALTKEVAIWLAEMRLSVSTKK